MMYAFKTLAVASAYLGLAMAGPTDSIVVNAQATPTLSTLVTLVTKPNQAAVLSALDSAGTMTVFAPSNTAFTTYLNGVEPADVPDDAALTSLLQYHVLGAKANAADLSAYMAYQALNKGVLVVRKDDAGVTVNGNSKVTTADVECSNGVVHIVDGVLAMPKTIVENAAATPTLSTLVSVLSMTEYAPVMDALTAGETLTVFAPTDAAFTAANIDTTDVATVTKVLQYHVAAAVAYSDSLTNDQKVATLEGSEVTVMIANGAVKINDATVTTPDVQSFNGVVHIIDKVLMPPMAPSGSSSTGGAEPTTAPGDVSGASSTGFSAFLVAAMASAAALFA